LIDATGTVRHIKAGEGGYDTTENLIRRLLADANPGVRLPPATRSADTTPKGSRTPETYLGVGKVVNYAGSGRYDEGTEKFNYPAVLPPDSFALRGHWALDYQGATAQSNDCAIRLNYRAKDVYIVVGGTGTVTVTRNGTTTAVPISGPPTLHQIVADDTSGQGQLDAHVSRGLQVFSFTYG